MASHAFGPGPDDDHSPASPAEPPARLPPPDWHWLDLRQQLLDRLGQSPGRSWLAAGAAVAVAVLAWRLFAGPSGPPDDAIPFVEVAQPADVDVGAGVPGEVVVHVAGAVWRPGVYALPAGERVADAIDAAGGVRRDGNPDSLNLAAPLVDGAQIYVAAEGELAGGPARADGLVSINQATQGELESLPGIGPATAKAIIDERERNGPFRSVDDLLRVRGIGDAKLDGFRDLVQL